MNPKEFERLVSEVGFSSVPEKFRGLISNVALTVEDDVSPETRADMKLAEDETLLGLYQGIPRTARGEGYGLGGNLPDRITLYRLPILEAAEEDGIAVQQVVEETVWHEVAHHFGLEEDEVEARESQNKKNGR